MSRLFYIKNKEFEIGIMKKPDYRSRCVACGKPLSKDKPIVTYRASKPYFFHPKCFREFHRNFEYLSKNRKSRWFWLKMFYYSPYDIMEEYGWDVDGSQTDNFMKGLIQLIPYHVEILKGEHIYYKIFWFHFLDVRKLRNYDLSYILELGRKSDYVLRFGKKRTPQHRNLELKEDGYLKRLLGMWKYVNTYQKYEQEKIAVEG